MDNNQVVLVFKNTNEPGFDDVQFYGSRMGDEHELIKLGTRYSVSDYPARQKALRDREVVVIVDVENEAMAAPYPFELEEMRAAGSGARMIVPLVVRDQAIGIIQLETETVASVGDDLFDML